LKTKHQQHVWPGALFGFKLCLNPTNPNKNYQKSVFSGRQKFTNDLFFLNKKVQAKTNFLSATFRRSPHHLTHFVYGSHEEQLLLWEAYALLQA